MHGGYAHHMLLEREPLNAIVLVINMDDHRLGESSDRMGEFCEPA